MSAQSSKLVDGRKVVGRFDSYTFPPKRIPKSPAKPQKPCGGFLSKFHTLQESHLVYGYTVILSVVLTVFLYAGCRSPYGTRGAVEMAYRLGQLAGQVCR